MLSWDREFEDDNVKSGIGDGDRSSGLESRQQNTPSSEKMLLEC